MTADPRRPVPTRPELWPVFSPPPDLPPLPAREVELGDVLELLTP